MDTTFWVIVGIIVIGTVLAMMQARRRDKCLRDFDGFHVTLAEKGGDITWGLMDLYSSGLEIIYDRPVVTRQGHLEGSFLFYKDQYAAIDALFRYPEGLSVEAKQRRRKVIEQTANPGIWRRGKRHIRNWISMIRDALLQVASVAIGAAKTRTPGAAVLSTQEQGLKALSSEIIGHAGNAFDPLLEAQAGDLGRGPERTAGEHRAEPVGHRAHQVGGEDGEAEEVAGLDELAVQQHRQPQHHRQHLVVARLFGQAPAVLEDLAGGLGMREGIRVRPDGDALSELGGQFADQVAVLRELLRIARVDDQFRPLVLHVGDRDVVGDLADDLRLQVLELPLYCAHECRCAAALAGRPASTRATVAWRDGRNLFMFAFRLDREFAPVGRLRERLPVKPACVPT